MSMSARQRRTTVPMAVTTLWALTCVCVTLPTSWDLMENSATVRLMSLYYYYIQRFIIFIWHQKLESFNQHIISLLTCERN